VNPSTLLPDWLRRCAENTPTRLAITCSGVSWSFAELDRQATRLARQLATLGIREGCRVALLAMNGLPFVVTVHALTRLGAILVPLNTRLTKEELCWQMQDVQAMWLLSDGHFAELATSIVQETPAVCTASLMAAPEEHDVLLHGGVETDVVLRDLIDIDALQSIMYTSGTTGKPKGVLITYGMQWWNAVGSMLNLLQYPLTDRRNEKNLTPHSASSDAGHSNRTIPNTSSSRRIGARHDPYSPDGFAPGHSADDCWLACLPLFHIGGLAILFRSVINGISVLLHEKFDAQAVNRAIKEEHVTITSVVTLMLQRMLAALDDEQSDPRYPATLRCVLLGGGPAPLPLLEDCVARGIPVAQSYGLTEACSQATNLAPADALRKLGSAGRPLIQVQLRIINEQGQDALVGEPGVICLKGPSITRGYDRRPEATAQAIHDGWLATGDIGYLDEDGYLYVLLIISGGENIYPAEIESILLSHPDIIEAGVCGQPDANWGQVPIAFVHLRSGSMVTADALQAFLGARLARYKQPRAIYVVGALPRNSAGKLLRRELPGLL
jgi:O-succinylbenzoic acid--CoA ligase